MLIDKMLVSKWGGWVLIEGPMLQLLVLQPVLLALPKLLPEVSMLARPVAF